MSFLPTAVGLASAYYLVGAIVLGVILLVLALEFRTRAACGGAAIVPRHDLPAAAVDRAPADHFLIERIDYTVCFCRRSTRR